MYWAIGEEAGERTYDPRDLAEMALAHAIENAVEATYRRGDMLAKRANMMQAWADFLDQTRRGENVLEFKAA